MIPKTYAESLPGTWYFLIAPVRNGGQNFEFTEEVPNPVSMGKSDYRFFIYNLAIAKI
jgi:hypothetical protein